MVIISPATADATTNTHSPPWADVINGPMWGGFDPRGAASGAVQWLDWSGYYTFNDNNNTDAAQAIGPLWALDDSVFVVFGHGLPGQIAVEKNGNVGAITANVNIAIAPDFANGVRANLHDKPSGYWNRMKLAAWIGCNTGVDADPNLPNQGNLVRESVLRLGADFSIGFRHLIYAVPNAMDLWTDAFFDTLNDNAGTPGTVGQAATAGLGNVRFWWGTANYSWGFENPYISGGGVTIRPTGYGNP